MSQARKRRTSSPQSYPQESHVSQEERETETKYVVSDVIVAEVLNSDSRDGRLSPQPRAPCFFPSQGPLRLEAEDG